MSNQRLTVEQVVEKLFYKTFQRSKEDLYIDNIKEFFIKFLKFTYLISLNETVIKELDDSSNSSRIDDVITIYLDIEEISGKVTFVISMGKTIVVKLSIFVSNEITSDLISYSSIDSESPLEFTIIPGIEFLDSAKSKEYVEKVFREHVLQIASRFSISEFKEDISKEYQVLATTIFVYGVRYITNIYRKCTNQKDSNIIDSFPRKVSIDELSIKRNDHVIRIYGRDTIIGDHTTWYCKVGFNVNYPGNIYNKEIINPDTNIAQLYSDFVMYLFNAIKQVINKEHKRNAYVSNVFTKVLQSSIKEKNEENVNTTEIDETIYFGHVLNKIKELFSCTTINNILTSTFSILDTSTVYSSIGSLINEGFYSKMYSDINTNIKYLVSIYRRNKSATTPSAMIIVLMDTENNVKFSKCIHFKTKRYPREGCQFVMCGDKNNASITTRDTFDNDKSFYIPDAIHTFKKFIEDKVDCNLDIQELSKFTHEKGRRDPVFVVQEITITNTVKYLITKCYYNETYEVIGVFNAK